METALGNQQAPSPAQVQGRIRNRVRILRQQSKLGFAWGSVLWSAVQAQEILPMCLEKSKVEKGLLFNDLSPLLLTPRGPGLSSHLGFSRKGLGCYGDGERRKKITRDFGWILSI